MRNDDRDPKQIPSPIASRHCRGLTSVATSPRLGRVRNMLRGAIAATATPFTPGGASLDEEAFAPLVAFLAEGGMDGILTCGSTGEGILLSVAERKRATELFLAARPAELQIAVHAGAQTTADTVALAGHARDIGADAVAVIGPPYFPLGEQELFEHFRAAAEACAPLPFYLYEFAARSGYAIPIPVVERLRGAVSNLAGLKVSDRSFEEFARYLIEGLDVFAGFEPLVLAGMQHGAVGAVSGLATAFPEIVAALVHEPSQRAHDQVELLRERLGGIPFNSALKAVLGARGVPVQEYVRAPLRGLTDPERSVVQEAARAVGALEGSIRVPRHAGHADAAGSAIDRGKQRAGDSEETSS